MGAMSSGWITNRVVVSLCLWCLEHGRDIHSFFFPENDVIHMNPQLQHLDNFSDDEIVAYEWLTPRTACSDDNKIEQIANLFDMSLSEFSGKTKGQ